MLAKTQIGMIRIDGNCNKLYIYIYMIQSCSQACKRSTSIPRSVASCLSSCVSDILCPSTDDTALLFSSRASKYQILIILSVSLRGVLRKELFWTYIFGTRKPDYEQLGKEHPEKVPDLHQDQGCLATSPPGGGHKIARSPTNHAAPTRDSS